ncbi:hypothetical protein RJ639_000282 [Escallonia herrerae]|uniref:Retrotransposon gag domain-containing protein n=1 Tax=Escallonia herrerae TaxID=1293975 RepID=A0AA88X835_9ASTE|nr:hypothetical protein RJ639_000282 [Escallonia herrerae]
MDTELRGGEKGGGGGDRQEGGDGGDRKGGWIGDGGEERREERERRKRTENTQPGADHATVTIHQSKAVQIPLSNRSPELRPLKDQSTKGRLSTALEKVTLGSRSRRKNSASLLNIVQEKNESLACYLGRFNAATLEIDNLDESVKYAAFLRGLQPTSKFAFSINKSHPGNMNALLEKANKYIQAEEYLETHRG